MRGLTTAFVVSIAAAALGNESAAADVTPMIGGPGGSPFAFTCPFPDDTGALTGLTGRAGAFIDGFWPICDGEIMSRSYFGGPGGSPFDIRCPAGKYVTGVNVYYGQYVNGLQIECYGRKDSKVWYSAWVGERSGAYAALRCGRGEFALAVSGRAGGFVDSIALKCDPIPWDVR